ncbi:hypothetical protein PAECIP111894_05202 [Paenibacillus pseudetheri]|uniref:Uncharacterized protein n=1 Tax=Paenibacillus pseudetheri TaxID=2897682 RepID=A0ABN8FLZ1_9BACL|nr:hypothetical protein PAECIP111894_05202 [Paenibacillus pseudetheri]
MLFIRRILNAVYKNSYKDVSMHIREMCRHKESILLYSNKSEMSECLLLSSGDSIPHLPGVNRLNMELKNEENSLIRNH